MRHRRPSLSQEVELETVTHQLPPGSRFREHSVRVWVRRMRELLSDWDAAREALVAELEEDRRATDALAAKAMHNGAVRGGGSGGGGGSLLPGSS